MECIVRVDPERSAGRHGLMGRESPQRGLCEADIQTSIIINGGFPCSSVGKESACNAGDLGSIPGSGRSPGGGNGNPLWYSCLENPMDRGAWRATVHRVARDGHD